MARTKMASVVPNGVDKNAKQQKKNIPKENKKNANKLKKNLKRTIEETVKKAPKKFQSISKKVVPSKHTKRMPSYRSTIYYRSKEAADAHHNKLKNNMAKHEIKNMLCESVDIDTTMLKIHVGYKVLTDEEKEELLMITKATSVMSAYKNVQPSLRKILLLKYDDAKVAEQIVNKGSFKFRDFTIVPSYFELKHENENEEEVKPLKKVQKMEEVPKVEEVVMEVDKDDEDEEDADGDE